MFHASFRFAQGAAPGRALGISAAIVVAALAVSCQRAPLYGQASQQQIVTFNQQQLAFGPPFGLVWAHQVFGVKSPYGGMGLPGQIRTLSAAKADGIDAVSFNCFAKADRMINTLNAGDQVGILIAPTVDMSVLYLKKHDSPQQIMQAQTQTIVDYCKLAAGYHCAAKTRDGRYIIWHFGSADLTPEEQAQSLANARSQGARFYIIGALGGRKGGIDPVGSLTRYAAVWDASYAFLPLDDSVRPQIKAAFVAQNKPLIATVMPQYTRPGMRFQQPPDGGVRYAQQWQEAIEDRAPAVNIVTLNDTADGSSIMPNYETQTKQFAAQYKKEVLGR